LGIDDGTFLREAEPFLEEMLKEDEVLKAYERGFTEIAKELRSKYKMDITPEDLRRQFILALKDELESIPRSEWRVDNLTWFKDLEFKAREKVAFDLAKQIEHYGNKT
jgi:hypothetical protein